MATDVEGLIETRLAEIEQELGGLASLQAEQERLKRALGELRSGRPASAGRQPGRRAPRKSTSASKRSPRRRQASRGSGKRAPRGSNQAAILEHISSNPGATAPDISKTTGIAKPVVYSALSRLTSTGRLRKKQQKDGQVTYELVAG